MEMQNNKKQPRTEMGNTMYKKLAIMILLSFAAMYILMYAMVNTFANVVPNVNQFYMAGLMSMPMLIIELAVMGNMYMKKKWNLMLMGIGVVALTGFFFCIRQQAGVTDRQFLRSMIPHHAAAILMVQNAKLSDPEVIQLGKNIVSGQQAEIEQMKNKLKEIEK